MRKLKVLSATLALTLLLATPAFAQTGYYGFYDLGGVTYGGNCLVDDYVEICDVNTGTGGL